MWERQKLYVLPVTRKPARGWYELVQLQSRFNACFNTRRAPVTRGSGRLPELIIEKWSIYNVFLNLALPSRKEPSVPIG
jgi:hypothetical protein